MNRMLRIGVVSDTHGHVPNTRAAIHMLTALEVELVLHCGDIGAAGIVPLFAAWPTHFVYGNVDRECREIADAIRAAGQHDHGDFGELDLAGTRVAWLHSDDGPRLERTIQCGDYRLVFHGHTHVVAQQRRGETVVLNPGALYRAPRHTIAIVTLPSIEVEIIEVD